MEISSYFISWRMQLLTEEQGIFKILNLLLEHNNLMHHRKDVYVSEKQYVLFCKADPSIQWPCSESIDDCMSILSWTYIHTSQL